MNLLSYDVTNAFSVACGIGVGVEVEELEALVPNLKQALAELESECGREAGFFLDLPSNSIEPEEALAEEIRATYDNLVVVGIGGSALGTRAIYRSLTRAHTGRFRDGRDPGNAVRLLFIENVDPVDIEDLFASIDLERTAFNIVTKSGTTIETISALIIIRDLLIRELGVEGYRARVICTTDPGTNALRKLAAEDGLRTVDIPPGVGGRFSALSTVGTLPLLCAGVDVRRMLKGGLAARDNALHAPLHQNAAALFAAIQTLFNTRGSGDVVFMAYITQFADLGEWFVQLWAESLGKRRADGTAVGPTPIPAIGARDQHSLLQLMMEGPLERNVVFVEDAKMPSTLNVPSVPESLSELAHLGNRPLSETLHAEQRGVEAALREAQRPSSTLRLNGISEETIGAFIVTLEVATAITGYLLEINPFDQPGVELGKRYAHGILGQDKHSGYLERLREDDERIPKRQASF